MTDEQPSSLEHLLQRVATGEASQADWTEFEALATVDPELWQRVVRTLQLESTLRREWCVAARAADTVELPDAANVEPAKHPQAASPAPARPSLAPPWMRWAALLLLGISGWIVAWRSTLAPSASAFPPNATHGRADVRDSHSDPARVDPSTLASDSERPDAIGEYPRIVLHSRPGPSGTLEVWYLRRTVEHAFVEDPHTLGVNEGGRPHPVAIDPVRLVSAERF